MSSILRIIINERQPFCFITSRLSKHHDFFAIVVLLNIFSSKSGLYCKKVVSLSSCVTYHKETLINTTFLLTLTCIFSCTHAHTLLQLALLFETKRLHVSRQSNNRQVSVSNMCRTASVSSVCLSVRSSVCTSAFLSVCLSVSLSVSIWLALCMLVSLLSVVLAIVASTS